VSTIVVDEAMLRSIVAEEVSKAIGPVVAALQKQKKGAHEGFMSSSELASILNVDLRTLRRLREAGDIPAPIIIGDRMLRWPRSVIETWIRKKEQRFALDVPRHAGSM
jgi:excisionase family DNA binding protein